ncbi:zinc finger, CCHC-type, Retrotransposon gag domain protein [Artemisia annua]|uniref:Zinc finger, CCHC-type, Retrotransposon gag domain protein n=1 Tax=Artemisia annua TaxID=35608 RepID=A0A2U1LAE7_ARTAN|nr:zinc finger, CCHC-type, Retrotransposon gag domain protein [Artemisia annua]
MVNTRRNGQPDGDEEIPNMEAMVATALANLFPSLTTTEMMTRIISDIRNGAGSSGGSGGGGQPTGIHTWLERFGKLKPLSFSSAATPQEAEDWITHMEKLFEAKGGEDYATTCTWTEFRNTFYQRYFPLAEQQRREYDSIYQFESENSGEYMQRFLRLASFVGPIAGDASRQAKHFKWGLKKWVLDRILNTDYADVSAVNDAARNIEIFHEGSGYNKRNRDGDCIQPRDRQAGAMSRGVRQTGVMIRGVSQVGTMIRGDRSQGVRTKGPQLGAGAIFGIESRS